VKKRRTPGRSAAYSVPEFVPNLQITVDYYNIKINDAIAAFGGGLQSVITACRANLSMSNIFCAAAQPPLYGRAAL
jgi:hypothetical protein